MESWLMYEKHFVVERIHVPDIMPKLKNIFPAKIKPTAFSVLGDPVVKKNVKKTCRRCSKISSIHKQISPFLSRIFLPRSIKLPRRTSVTNLRQLRTQNIYCVDNLMTTKAGFFSLFLYFIKHWDLPIKNSIPWLIMIAGTNAIKHKPLAKFFRLLCKLKFPQLVSRP